MSRNAREIEIDFLERVKKWARVRVVVERKNASKALDLNISCKIYFLKACPFPIGFQSLIKALFFKAGPPS